MAIDFSKYQVGTNTTTAPKQQTAGTIDFSKYTVKDYTPSGKEITGSLVDSSQVDKKKSGFINKAQDFFQGVGFRQQQGTDLISKVFGKNEQIISNEKSDLVQKINEKKEAGKDTKQLEKRLARVLKIEDPTTPIFEKTQALNELRLDRYVRTVGEGAGNVIAGIYDYVTKSAEEKYSDEEYVKKVEKKAEKSRIWQKELEQIKKFQAGENIVSKNVSKAIKKWADETAPSEQYYSEKLTSSAGSMGIFMLMSLGSAGNPYIPVIIESIGEAGNVYSTLREEGAGVEEAGNKSDVTLGANLVLNTMLNIFGFIDEEKSIKLIVKSFGEEGVQEGSQQVISNLATNRPWDEGVLESAIIGGLTAGITSVVYPSALPVTQNTTELNPQVIKDKVLSDEKLSKSKDGQQLLKKALEAESRGEKLVVSVTENGKIMVGTQEVSLETQQTTETKQSTQIASSGLELANNGVYAELTQQQLDFLKDEVKNIDFTKDDRPHLSPIEKLQESELEKVTLEELRKLSPNIDKALAKLEQLDRQKTKEVKIEQGEVSEPKIKEAVEETDLAKEARKYKSAEEFIKAQPKLYHGTFKDNDFSKFDINRAGSGVGQNKIDQGNQIYLTSDKNAGEWFARTADDNYQMQMDRTTKGGIDFKPGRGGTVLEFSIKPGAKIKELDKMPRGAEQAQKLIDNLKKQGYDLITFPDEGFKTVEGISPKMFKNGQFPKTTIVLNQDKIISKSQLIDIWNKANKPTFKAKVEPSKKAKSPEKKLKTVSKKESIETKTQILPKNESIYEESKKVGAKRLSPDRILHHQMTPQESISKIKNSLKKDIDLLEKNRPIRASQKVIREFDEIELKIKNNEATEAEKKWFNRVKEQMNIAKAYSELKDFVGADKNIFKEELLQKAREKLLSENGVKNYYIKLVKEDISKGYKFPPEVLSFDRSFTIATNNRARYEKGLRTSFSADDERIVFDDKNRIIGGLKRQDGSQITQAQIEEIVNGVLQTQEALGIDMNKIARDERWIYAHLNGKNPFLTANAGGMYRKTEDGNISISVGGTESFWTKIDGKRVKKKVNTTIAHELGHALDHHTGQKIFSGDDVWELKKTYNPIEYSPRSSKYWSSSSEIKARAIEQYVAVKNGHNNYFKKEAYWNEEIYDKTIIPMVEGAMDKYFSEYQGKPIKPESIKQDVQEATKAEKKEVKPKVKERKTRSTVQDSLEIKASKVAVSIEQNLNQRFENLAGFETRNVKSQAKLVSKLIAKDINLAKDIVTGAKPLPAGMSGSMFIAGMENYATQNNDIDLLRSLATSPLVSETSVHAQELRFLAERDKTSVLSKIQELANERAKIFKKTHTEGLEKAIEKETKKIKDSVKISKWDWDSFIKSIEC